MDAFDDLNTFSFLNADTSMQEEFIKQLKFMESGSATGGDVIAAAAAAAAVGVRDNDEQQQQLESPQFDASGDLSSLVMAPQSSLSQRSQQSICCMEQRDEHLEPPSPSSPYCSSSLGNDEMHHSLCAQDSSPRSWKLVHLSSLLLANRANSLRDLNYFTDNIHIEVRTRSDLSDPHVPERLYSSLKYEMRHSVKRELLLDSTNVLMCKVEVVDPQDHQEEILKTNGQKLIKGIQEVTAMSRNPSGGALECKMKIQFTDVSYHHEKKYFGFKVSFIDPLIHVSEPVIVLVSAPFQVFARRPTTRTKKESVKKNKNKQSAATVTVQPANDSHAAAANCAPPIVTAPLKRKEAPAATAPQTPSATITTAAAAATPSKKMKFSNHASALSVPSGDEKMPSVSRDEKKINLKRSANLQDFLQCLDLLVAFKNSLTNDEQAVALEAAHRRLLQMAGASPSSHPTKLSKKHQQLPPAEQDSINSFFSDI